jgi:hypothetical protein
MRCGSARYTLGPQEIVKLRPEYAALGTPSDQIVRYYAERESIHRQGNAGEAVWLTW